jgi:hypothetical protein
MVRKREYIMSHNLCLKTSSGRRVGGNEVYDYKWGYRSGVREAVELPPETLKSIAEFDWDEYGQMFRALMARSIRHATQPIVVNGKLRDRLLPLNPPPESHTEEGVRERLKEPEADPDPEITRTVKEASAYSQGFVDGVCDVYNGTVDHLKFACT